MQTLLALTEFDRRIHSLLDAAGGDYFDLDFVCDHFSQLSKTTVSDLLRFLIAKDIIYITEKDNKCWYRECGVL